MRVQMRRRACERGFNCDSWDIGLVGEPLDDRGRTAHECVRRSTTEILRFSYDAREMTVAFGESQYHCDELEDAFSCMEGRRVLLETTTLGVPELLLACKALSARQEHVSMLYLEPMSYNAPRRTKEVLARRDFELSDSFLEFQGIPGWTMPLDETEEQLVVLLLGYEGGRLDRAVEDLPIRPSQCHLVFGVPAFQAGWEMDSFSNNVPIICEQRLGHGISFCGAANPQAVYDTLVTLHAGQPKESLFFVAPLGTKPHAIGAALFACEYPSIGVLFDHPSRREKRTSQIGSCHVYVLELVSDDA